MNLKIFSILFFAMFSSMLGQGIVVPLLPIYAHELGATGLHIGFIFGAFSISRTLALPYFGHLSDVKGRKPFIIWGLFAYFIASIAFTLSTTVNQLILIRFLQGISAAMILPVAQAYAGEITPRGKEGWVMGTLNISLYGGLGAGPILGGVIKDAFGLQASFFSMGLLCLSGFILCVLLLPPREEEHTFARGKASANYRILLKNRSMSGLFFFRFTYTLCVGSVWAFSPLLADTEFGFSSLAVGMLISLSVLVSALLMAPMGFLADRTQKISLIASGGLITFLAMLLFAFARNHWMLYAASVIMGIGGGISIPSVMAMTVVLGREKESMGSIMSIMVMAHSLGMIFGPIFAGLMMDIIDIRVAFGGSAVIILVSTIITLILISDFKLLEKY
jgi:DHA1 family multidrug resistance protein-like MFS transporter